jgi:hypothetical protein
MQKTELKNYNMILGLTTSTLKIFMLPQQL